MKTLAAEDLCLEVLDEALTPGEVVVVTKGGVPVARLAPMSQDEGQDWKGAMIGSGEILGDLVAPAVQPEDWEAPHPAIRAADSLVTSD